MKIKILPLFIVILLIFTSINVVGSITEKDTDITLCEQTDHLTFSKASVSSDGEYISLNLKEANSFLSDSGQPMLPVVKKTIKFPYGTKIKNVDISLGNVNVEKISGKIKPAPVEQPLISITKTTESEDKIIAESSVYSSSNLYPNKWYDYKISVGREGNNQYLYLNLVSNPVRYSPSEDLIYSLEDIDINIVYEKAETQLPAEKDYDLVIITPARYYSSVIPLKIHKEKLGFSTKIKTTESIYLSYLGKANGRDKQEKIKKFIYDSYKDWNTKYILLVGGRIRNTFRFSLPVRFSNLHDRSEWNDSYVTDLYYADVERYNETRQEYEFEDWDSNGNGIFGEWTWTLYYEDNVPEPYWWWGGPIVSQDIIDLYPDVYIGRLACLNKHEVRTVVNKIINYEKNTHNKSWFKRMIVAGGDTVPVYDNTWPNYYDYEGEIENEYAAGFMEPLGFNVDRYWASNGNLTNISLIPAIADGAGFLFCAGHGNPMLWTTHQPNSNNWIDALWNSDMGLLWNKQKLPIVVVGGCHNSQFNVGIAHMIRGLLEHGLDYYIWDDTMRGENCYGKVAWAKRCWSWNLVRQRFGGAIAAIGNTGLGWGVGGEESVDSLDGWVSTRFFKFYSELQDQENCTLGMVHSSVISGFLDEFYGTYDWDDRAQKTVEEWALLGDPTLKIGGYPEDAFEYEE